MRQTGRGIVIKDSQILLIEKRTQGLHYFSIPGGGKEPKESISKTVAREIYEETSIRVNVGKQLYELSDPDGNIHKIFLCEYLSGEPKLLPDSEEAGKLEDALEEYEPQWVPLSKIIQIPFLYWQPIGQRIADDYKNGWSKQTIKLHTKSFISYTGKT